MYCGRKGSVWAGVLAAGLFLLVSCDKPEPAPDLTNAYNALAKELIALRESATSLYKNTREENQALGQFNIALEEYLVVRNRSFDDAEQVTRAFPGVVLKYDDLLNTLSELEAISVHTLDSLNSVGDKVLKPEEKNLGRSYVAMITLRYALRGKQLDGMRRLVETDFQEFCDSNNKKLGTTLALAPRRKIAIRKDEFMVAKLIDGHTVIRDPETGHLTFLHTEEDARGFAERYAFDLPATHHYFSLSERLGGFLTFANKPEDVGFALTDVLTRIKYLMNENQEGLDLVLLVEGSRDAVPLIHVLKESLIHLHLGVGAIKNAGRTARTGLVSYRTAGAEVVESDLSTYSYPLSLALLNLEERAQATTSSSSQAIYHGLHVVSELPKWDPKANRVVVLITRAVPSEVGTPAEASFIESTVQKYGNDGKRLRLFTILTH